MTQTRPKPYAARPEIDFCYWQPAFDHFPLQIWRQLATRHLQTPDLLDYSADLLGYKVLREAIAHYLIRSRAVRCNAEQIIIVNGTQQALDLITDCLLTQVIRLRWKNLDI